MKLSSNLVNGYWTIRSKNDNLIIKTTKGDGMKGKTFQCKTSSKIIKVIKKYGGNGHWVCNQLNGKKQSHHIHEGTIKKFYEEIK